MAKAKTKPVDFRRVAVPNIRFAVLRESDFTAGQWTAITANALAQQEIPDTALPKISAVFPGTAKQTAAATLAYMIPLLRAHVKNEVLETRRETDQVTVNTGHDQELASFDVAFP